MEVGETMSKECDVCGGEGTYPIMNMGGREVYSIECPECGGSGEEYDEEAERVAEAYEAELDKVHPRSTAARVSSLEEMRNVIKNNWNGARMMPVER